MGRGVPANLPATPARWRAIPADAARLQGSEGATHADLSPRRAAWDASGETADNDTLQHGGVPCLAGGGPLVSTEMAGPEPAMRAEGAYLTLLGQARSYRVDAGRLTLFDGDGNESLIFAAMGR